VVLEEGAPDADVKNESVVVAELGQDGLGEVKALVLTAVVGCHGEFAEGRWRRQAYCCGWVNVHGGMRGDERQR
jgi:hypothetical protein